MLAPRAARRTARYARPAVFISLEGIDRSGKSTQARLLAEALGPEAVVLREPGGTPAGERMREILTDPGTELDPLAELLLFCAARAELCARVIRPALEAGRDVVTDRFTDSTVAYQGVARGLGSARVRALCEEATGGLEPDITVLLEIAPESAARRGDGGVDRFEAEGLDFQRDAARGYAEQAELHPLRIVVLDAEQPPEEVHAEVLAAVQRRRPATDAGAR